MGNQSQILSIIRVGGIPYALLILAVTFVIGRLVTRSLDRLSRRFTDRRLIIQQAGSFVRFGLYIVGGVAAAATALVLTREVMLAIGGTIAVSLGIALKDLFASFVAGILILADKPFQVGDRVTFGGYYGEIKEIGLRSVRLMTLDDTLVTVPNSRFLTDVVASGNAGAVQMMVQFDFHIAADEDVAQAKRIVTEALTTSRYVHLGFPWAVLTSQVAREGYIATRLRAKAYVLDVRFEKAFESDVTERVLCAFREAEVHPPAVLHREASAAAARKGGTPAVRSAGD
jgi:small-conductance mechanosensitive channel